MPQFKLSVSGGPQRGPKRYLSDDDHRALDEDKVIQLGHWSFPTNTGFIFSYTAWNRTRKKEKPGERADS